MKSLYLALAVLAAAPLTRAASNSGNAVQDDPGTVCIFARNTLNTGDVRVFDEATGASLATPDDLRGIRILPIDFVGRTQLLEFTEGRPRYMTDVPSASRLVLPKAQGSLYRFSRQTPEGRVFGFMHIDGKGAPHALAQRIASGRLTGTDPYLPLIAVSPEGDSFMVATRFEAGGDAYEVDLKDGRVFNRTGNTGPLAIRQFGLGLQKEWGVIAAHRGVLRFKRASSKSADRFAIPISFGQPWAWYQGDLVFSLNGKWAMTVLGNTPDTGHVWAFSADTAPRRVSVMPNPNAGAGFLPEFRAGPFKAISDDGMLCAWVNKGASSRELHIGRGPEAGVLDSEQVTRPLYFHDTLDEIGQAGFFKPDRLTFLAGAKDYIHTGMNRADVFEATMPQNSDTLQIENLSMTSGEDESPYTEYGTVEPDRVLWSPYDERFVIFDGEHGKALYTVDAEGTGLTSILTGIQKLNMLNIARQGVLFDARRTAEAGGLHEMYRLHSLDTVDPVTLVSTVSVDTEFVRPALRRDGWVTFVAVDTDEQTEVLSKVNVGSGAFQSFALTSQSYGPALGYTHRGSVLFSLETPGATSYMLWPFGSSQGVALQASPDTGFVLPPF